MPKNIISFLLLIILVFVTAFFGLPKYREFSAIGLEVKEKKTELEDKEKYFSELKTLSASLEEFAPELAKVDSALPSESSIPDLLNFLQKVSSQNGLILERFDVGRISPEEKPDIKKISLNLSLTGSYQSFKNFLFSLQENSRLIEAESINFSSPEKSGLFTFNLNVKTYSY